MLEGDHGELTAPAQRQRNAAEDAKDVVAASLGAVEAVVGALPHAVDAVSSIGFCQYVLKEHLHVETSLKLSNDVMSWFCLLHWSCLEDISLDLHEVGPDKK